MDTLEFIKLEMALVVSDCQIYFSNNNPFQWQSSFLY